LLFFSPAYARVDIMTLGDAPQPPVGYSHLPYANPAAPKGGSLTIAALGGFDSLNPFILRGTAPDTILQVWQPLFKLSDVDSVTEYAELARDVRVQGDEVMFDLDPRAKFSDGTTVTASDVVWSWRVLVAQGLPFYASEYGEVAGAAAPDARTVVFTLKPGAGADALFNLAGLYVLPAHFWAGRNFASPLKDFPVGSGPYRVASVAWNGSITYSRVRDWWAADIPADAGFDNFDNVTELFYRDPAVLAQAFRAGVVDELLEPSPAAWRRDQDFADRQNGRVRLEEVPLSLPAGMSGLVMNTRRAVFADPKVRQAMLLAFDFQWINQALLGGGQVRDDSYFSNSDMAATGAPSAAERALLAPYRRELPASVVGPPPVPPVTDGSGHNLPQRRQAYSLLTAAGWQIRDFRLVDATGAPMRFEVLVDDERSERIAIAYAADLRLLGIEADVRLLDPVSYARRLENFDFDMAPGDFPESAAPGSEQAGYWGCVSAATPGSENLAGICSPAVDAMIAAEVAARDPAQKRAAVHALDRLLRAGAYIVPWFHAGQENLAYWANKVANPDVPLQVGVDMSLWWAK
jgi:microcin C transport system substrate-binding protein